MTNQEKVGHLNIPKVLLNKNPFRIYERDLSKKLFFDY